MTDYFEEVKFTSESGGKLNIYLIIHFVILLASIPFLLHIEMLMHKQQINTSNYIDDT